MALEYKHETDCAGIPTEPNEVYVPTELLTNVISVGTASFNFHYPIHGYNFNSEYIENTTICIDGIQIDWKKALFDAKAENPDYKYSEDKIVNDLRDYLAATYSEHYNNTDNMQCLDAWIALGAMSTTCRDTAIKYLWRYGKKNGNNKKDLMKALHYIVLMLHVDHYNNKKETD